MSPFRRVQGRDGAGLVIADVCGRAPRPVRKLMQVFVCGTNNTYGREDH